MLMCGMVIVMILCFSGCNKTSRQYGHAPVVEDLTWGMTRDEIVNNLNLSDTNSTMTISEQSKAYLIIHCKDKKQIFGRSCYVNLLVTTKNKEERWNCPTDALSAIVLQYENADYETVREAMIMELGIASEADYSDNTEVLIWNSKDTIKDVSEKEKEKLQSYCEAHAVEEKSIYPKNENTAINKITLGVGKNNKTVVTYYGDWSVYINYLRKNE